MMEMVLTGKTITVERLAGQGFVNYLEDRPQAVRERAEDLA